jgi:hypothetical protein
VATPAFVEASTGEDTIPVGRRANARPPTAAGSRLRASGFGLQIDTKTQCSSGSLEPGAYFSTSFIMSPA